MIEITVSENEVFNIESKNRQLFANGEPLNCEVVRLKDKQYHLLLNGKSFTATVEKDASDDKLLSVHINGKTLPVSVKQEMDQLLERMGLADALSAKVQDLKAPMPGLILDVYVEPGQEIKAGDKLLLLEAMKMENVIKAEGDGIVAEVPAKKGEKVEKNALLVKFTP